MTEKRLGTKVLWNMLSVAVRAIGLSASIMLSVATVRADTVLDWNVTALKTTAAAPCNLPLETRNLASANTEAYDSTAGSLQRCR